jgi:hypothetical protein
VEMRPDEVCDRLIGLVKQVSGSAAVFPAPFPVGTQLSPQSDITPENFQSVTSIQGLVERMLSMRRH